MGETEYTRIQNELISQYNLDLDQEKAFLEWALNIRTKRNSLLLIHGVFGSGKSHLVTVMAIFLSKIAMFAPDKASRRQLRMLLSSNTNIAVDRLLEGLLDKKFHQFVRVGNLKRISKQVLPYAVANKKNEDIKELRVQLSKTFDSADKDSILMAILRLEQNSLGDAQIVGVTCMATMLDCMENEHFPIVVLDEASQLTEPLSLLPLRFQAKHVVCIGDPQQLPPTLETECAHEDHLEKTLFERLAKAGCPVVQLFTQYRCQPQISKIPNELFYSSRLVNGVTSFGNAPSETCCPVYFINVPGREKFVSEMNSYVNEAEATEIIRFCKTFFISNDRSESQKSMLSKDVGVISLYRGQAGHISSQINSSGEDLNKNTGECDQGDDFKISNTTRVGSKANLLVSTVDAFQGSEKRIVLVSCVRTASIGFSDDSRRLNVMLTRAREYLFIFGHYELFSRNPLWARILSYCQVIEVTRFRTLAKDLFSNDNLIESSPPKISHPNTQNLKHAPTLSSCNLISDEPSTSSLTDDNQLWDVLLGAEQSDT
jgi:energy-coupling factor transporter ATP-binding protein EcfA2